MWALSFHLALALSKAFQKRSISVSIMSTTLLKNGWYSSIESQNCSTEKVMSQSFSST